jgi:hypothetical protein
MIMLLFAGCNDNNHTLPRDDQWLKHAEVEYGKYAKDDVYIAKGVCVAKGKYIEYAKDGVYVAKDKYGKYAKEDASIKRATTSLLPKKATTNLLPKMATGLGMTTNPLLQGRLATYVMQDDDSLLPQRALGPRTPCKATTSPSPQ